MEITIKAKDQKAGMTGEELLEIMSQTRNSEGALPSRIKGGLGWSQQIQKVTLIWD